jgi:hypothetical protein
MKDELTVYRWLINFVKNLRIFKTGEDVHVGLPASSIAFDNLFD